MENEAVKKHVAAIHIKNTLSLLERKMANILLMNAYEFLPTKTEHTIRIHDLARLAGFDSNNHQVLKDALKALAETTLEWNILDSYGKQESWGVTTMLAQAETEKGLCRYAYSPALSRKLYNPEIYARISLAIQRKFSSNYALALYENCIRYAGVGSTGWWPIATCRALLGVDDKEYPAFKDFNKWVIKPSVAQVNEYSDIQLEMEPLREKRRIVSVRFKIQQRQPFRLNLLDPEEEVVAPASAPPATGSAAAESESPVVAKLQEFGLSKVKAFSLLARQGEDYILENLAVVERDYLAGKVDNLPGYTVAALKHDYRPKATPFEAAQTGQRQSAQTRREQRAQAQAQLQRLQSDWDRRRLQAALDGLTAAEREALESRFRATYTGNPIYQKWGKDGLTHPVMQSLFRAFASQELLTEASEVDLAVFAAGAGCNLQALRAAAAAG